MDTASLLAYSGAIVTIIGALSVIGLYVYKKGKPYAVTYLQKLLKANEENTKNCIKNAEMTRELQEESIKLRTDFQKEALTLHKENNKQSVFNGKILQEIKDLKENIEKNTTRITQLELDKQMEELLKEKKEFQRYKEC